jgi:hypothetical protein
MSWPKQQQTSEAARVSSVEDMFSNMEGGANRTACEGGGIVGALNCEVIDPISNLNGIGSERPDNAATTATSGGDNGVGETLAETSSDQTELITAEVVLRPRISKGPPLNVRFEPVSSAFTSDPRGIAPEQLQTISSDMKKLGPSIQAAAVSLDEESVTELANGEGVSLLSLAALPAYEKSADANVSVPDTIRVAEGCATLLNLYQKRARDVAPFDRALQRLADTKKRLRALKGEKDWLKRLGNEFDPESFTTPISTLEEQIKRQERRVAELAKPLEADDRAIIQLNQDLDEAEEQARLTAVRSDPKAVEHEKTLRVAKAKDAYREFRNREKLHAATTEEYRKQLANFDERIANEKDDNARQKLIEDRERYQRLADSWSDQSRRITANRYRDLARELKKNSKDELGPASMQELISDLEARGENPAQLLEGYSPESIPNSVKRATRDALTLGGTASQADDAWQFVKDTAEALDEERNNVILTPQDLAQKTLEIAQGKTTVEEVFNNQAKFAKRYANYGKGAAVGSVKGLVGVGELAYEASSLTMESGQALAESALSELAGEKVEIDYFGNSRVKKLDKAAAAAGNYLSKKYHEKKVPETSLEATVQGLMKDPASLGDYIADSLNPVPDALGDVIVSGSGLAKDLTDRRLSKVTRGGEKALGEELYNFGEVVGEAADLGSAVIAARQANKVGKLASGLDDALDAGDAARRLSDRASDLRPRSGDNAAGSGGELAAATERFDDVLTPTTPTSGAPRAETEKFDQVLDAVPPPGSRFANDPARSDNPAFDPDAETFNMNAATPDASPRIADDLASAKTQPPPATLQEGAPDPAVSSRPPNGAASASGGGSRLESQLSENAGRIQDQLPKLPEFTPLQSAESVSSPYKKDVTVELDAATPRRPFALKPNREGRIMNNRDDAEGMGLMFRNADGSVQEYNLGEKLGGGASTSAYTSVDRAGNPDGAAIRLTAYEAPSDLVRDVAGRNILETAQRPNSHFRTNTKLDGQGLNLVQIKGKQYMLSKEPKVVDALQQFDVPGGHVPKSIPEGVVPRKANALEQLTMEISVRDANMQGVVLTDNKRANIAIVEELVDGGTGYVGVFHDTGGAMAAKGLSASDRAKNARRLQLSFDEPASSVGRAYINLATSGYDDLVDLRNFGRFADDLSPVPPLTAAGNMGRTRYFELQKLSPQELRQYVRTDPEIRRLLAEKGRAPEEIRIPGLDE